MVGRMTVVIVTVLLQQFVADVQAGSAYATSFRASIAEDTNKGTCGYNNVFSPGYGTSTTALNYALFNDGQSCCAFYSLQCTRSSACTSNSIVVTALNECPQGSYEGWCDSPNQHFHVSEPAFSQIASVRTGVVPVTYTEPAFSQIASVGTGVVPVTYTKSSCSRSGGIRFYIQGHTYYLLVLVYNVGGVGDISSVSVKGSNSGWISMQRSWGVNFYTSTVLDGQALSFQVTTSDGKTCISNNVAASDWSYYQTYEGSNF